MSNESNPYTPPSAADRAERLGGPVRQAMRRIIVRWELLRVVYCGALIPLVILASLVLQPEAARTVEFWLSVAVGGVLANVCYLAGPAVEMYAIAMGWSHPLVPAAVFLAGTFLTAALAVWCIAGYASML